MLFWPQWFTKGVLLPIDTYNYFQYHHRYINLIYGNNGSNMEIFNDGTFKLSHKNVQRPWK